MNRQDADIMVIGAGPGGSMAAATAARAGARVLLLDRAEFPRDKVCGDFLSTEALELLRRTVLDSLPSSTNGWQIEGARRYNWSGEVRFREMEAEGELGPIVMSRRVLDDLLRKQALAGGAAFERVCVTEPLFEGSRVVGVRGKSDGRIVERRGGVIIAADGAFSAVARKLLPKHGKIHQGLAIRAYLPTREDNERVLESYHPEWLVPGYGWYFPAGPRRANVGVGIRRDMHIRWGRTPLRDLLDRLLDIPAISSRACGPPEEIKAWPVALCSDLESSRVFDGALLVGDAGRFTNPLTGEGICQAMHTGVFAAQAALEALAKGDTSRRGLKVYDELWHDELSEKMRWSRRIADFRAGMALARMRSRPRAE